MILGRLYDLALWPHPWPWPWSFKVRVWNSFISGMGGRLTMNEKDVSHPFMTMILTCVTKVGWADVLDSDRGDFIRQRAVDISSLYYADGMSMFYIMFSLVFQSFRFGPEIAFVAASILYHCKNERKKTLVGNGNTCESLVNCFTILACWQLGCQWGMRHVLQ